jgi:hypothetical protein
VNAFDDRLSRLQKAYPDAPLKALLRVPQSFDQDPAKTQASIRTWTVALELASMMEWRVAGLAKVYRVPFPGVLGPDFRELAQGRSAAFLRRIEQAPAPRPPFRAGPIRYIKEHFMVQMRGIGLGRSEPRVQGSAAPEIAAALPGGLLPNRNEAPPMFPLLW